MSNTDEINEKFSETVLSGEKHRAQKLGRITDSEEMINVAVKYFKNRCAFSGERFVNTKTKNKTNMSLEHVVALDAGGHHIAPNIVPSVLKYNIRKNNLNLLDYWEHEKDKTGKSIYNPYRLLNVVNYMLRSIKARNLSLEGKEYEEAVLESNGENDVIFSLLERADKDGRLFSDNETDIADKLEKRKITSYKKKNHTMIKLLVKTEDISSIEIFLSDAIKKLEEELKTELSEENYRSIITQLGKMYSDVKTLSKDIDIEIKIRDVVITKLKENGIDNIYTIADELAHKEMKKFKTIGNELDEKTLFSQLDVSLSNKLNELFQLFPKDKAMDYIKTYPTILYDGEIIKRLQKYQKLNLDIEEIDIRNIDFAMKIIEEFRLDGISINEERQRELLPQILGYSSLKGEKCILLSTLYANLKGRGLNDQEVYGAIINYAIGQGNQTYSSVLLSQKNIPEKDQIKKEVTNEILETFMKNARNKKKIETMIEKIDRFKSAEELKQKLCDLMGENIRLEDIRTDSENIKFALAMVDELRINGETMDKRYKGELLRQLLKNSYLNEGRGTLYLSSLYANLLNKDLNDNEALIAMINYAIGRGNQSYSSVLLSQKNIPDKDQIKKNIAINDLEEFLKSVNIKRKSEEEIHHIEISKLSESQLKQQLCDILGENIKSDDIKTDPENIRFVLKMMEEFVLNDKPLSNEMQRELIPQILGKVVLNKGGRKFLKNLYVCLANRGLSKQQIYGAIINYAIGEGDQGYSVVLNSLNKIPEKSKINFVVDEYSLRSDKELKQELCNRTEGGILLGKIKTDSKNIKFVLKMMDKFEIKGEKISEERQRELIPRIICLDTLNRGKSSLQTLYTNLLNRGLNSQEAYGAIINYAIGEGNQGYKDVLSSQRNIPEKEKINFQVDEESLKSSKEIKQELCDKIGENIRLEDVKTDARNIRFTFIMMRKFKLSGVQISEEEQARLISKILNQTSLNEGRGGFLSTLYANLRERNLDEQEAYGAIINYAIGEGNQGYRKVLDSQNNIPEKEKINYEVDEYSLRSEKELKQELCDRVEGNVRPEDIKTNPQNIRFVFRMMKEFRVNGARIRKEREERLIPKILNHHALNENRSRLLSSIFDDLISRGLDKQEAYGAIINYAIGEGKQVYKEVLDSSKKIPEKDEIKIDVTEEVLEKFMKKVAKKEKAKKVVRESVTPDSLKRMDETEKMIADAVRENGREKTGTIER